MQVAAETQTNSRKEADTMQLEGVTAVWPAVCAATKLNPKPLNTVNAVEQ
jgi:hypothetical protein